MSLHYIVKQISENQQQAYHTAEGLNGKLMHSKIVQILEKLFNMSSIVLDNNFKTLSPFIDALVSLIKMSATVCSTQPQSKFQLVNVLKLALQVNFVYQLRHHASS